MTEREAIKLLSEIRDSEYVKYMGIKTAVFNEKAIEAFDLAISALEKQEQDRWHVVAEEGNNCYGCMWRFANGKYAKDTDYDGFEPTEEWITRMNKEATT